MRTLRITFTNVQFVQARSALNQEYGNAEHAGPFSISPASRNGLPMKDQQRRSGKAKKESFLRQGNGDVRGAICRKTFFPHHIHAGVRRRATLAQFLACHRTRAARPVASIVCSRRSARTRASFSVMPVLVRHVLILVLCRAATAARILPLGDV